MSAGAASTASISSHLEIRQRSSSAGKMASPHKTQMSKPNNKPRKDERASERRRENKRARVDGDSPPAAKQMKGNNHKAQSKLAGNEISPATTEALSSIANDKSALLVNLASTHTVSSMNITSSSQINKKATKVLELLADFSFGTTAPKPNIVILSSKAASASKMITVAEIAKREIGKAGGKWYQYNSLESITVTKEEEKLPTRRANGDMEVDESSERDEEAAEFETLKTPFERAIQGRPKIQAIPSMTIFLSRVRIQSLKKAYSEQSNA